MNAEGALEREGCSSLQGNGLGQSLPDLIARQYIGHFIAGHTTLAQASRAQDQSVAISRLTVKLAAWMSTICRYV